jgi:F-type H+-transporting ATPase subunit a
VRFLAATGPSITIGDQPTFKLFGLTFDTYVIFSTLVAAAIVLGLGFRMRAQVTHGRPSKLQLGFETLVEQIRDLTSSSMGAAGERFVPLGVVLFFFILVSNWIEFIPSTLQVGVSQELLPAPTSDVNLPAAMAVMVFVLCHVLAVRTRGLKGYLRHYAKPFWPMIPINVIEEITKPITLTFRLFGNLFAGGLMIVVVAIVGAQILGSIGGAAVTALWTAWWKPFDAILIGAIQALIFALLTIMYVGMATAEDH